MIVPADNGDNERLIRIAEDVADGHDVDWGTAESTASNDDERELVQQMRAVEEIAQVHRVQMSSSSIIPSEPLLPTHWGRLEVLEKIGRGAFGEVYRARETALDREVALKLIPSDADEPPTRADAILEEGRLLARVDHENVARVYGAERHAGRVGIWMELIHGQTLEQLIEQQGRMSPEEAVRIGRDLCRAVAAIHRAGVIHRDIKSTNVMRQEGGRIILMDLGTGSEIHEAVHAGGHGEAESIDDDRSEDSAQRSPSLVGTPLYMAPETLLHREVTARSDLYSLGVLLYHLVTASYPVKGRTLDQLREAHERGMARPLLDERPDLPDAFVQVVERAIDRDPARRFASAGEFEHALASITHPRVTEPWWRRWLTAVRTRPRMRVLSVASATLLVLIAFGGAALVRSLIGGSYSVDAAFYRVPAGAPGGRERLSPGDDLRVGDRIMLEIEGSKQLFVYVLSEDDRGDAYLLFPNAWSELENPLPGSEPIRLPGTHRETGEEFYWLANTSGGREHIVVVASPQRLPDVERELRSLPAPSQHPDIDTSPYRPLPDRAKYTFRGLGGLAKSEAGSTDREHQPGIVWKLTKPYEKRTETLADDEVWMRQIDLDYVDESAEP